MFLKYPALRTTRSTMARASAHDAMNVCSNVQAKLEMAE